MKVESQLYTTLDDLFLLVDITTIGSILSTNIITRRVATAGAEGAGRVGLLLIGSRGRVSLLNNWCGVGAVDSWSGIAN